MPRYLGIGHNAPDITSFGAHDVLTRFFLRAPEKLPIVFTIKRRWKNLITSISSGEIR